MFEAIARFSVKFRWPIIIIWIVLVPILTHAFPSINDVAKNNTSDFLPKNSPTSAAMNLEDDFQGKGSKSALAGSALIIMSRASGPLTAADQAEVPVIIHNVEHVEGVSSVKNEGASADGQAQQLLVELNNKALGTQAFNIVKDIRSAMRPAGSPGGLQVNLTGDFAASIDSANQQQTGRNNTELYTTLLIIVLLLLVFRSLLAPLLTLIPAGLALLISQPVVAELTKAGLQVSSITQILLIVLVLGAGTDYGLFLVFRVREELQRGLEPKDAVVKALAKVGESITFSAATVVAALLSLMLASFGIYKGLGPGLAVSLVIMLLVALTFLPALLAIVGRAAFWPTKTRKRDIKAGLWGRVADAAVKRPRTVIIVSIVVFGALACGIIGYKASGFGNQAAPAGSDSAIGEQVLAKHFPAAENNPQLLILQFRNSVWTNNNLTAVRKAQNLLAASNQFKDLTGPFTANGLKLTPAKLEALHEHNPSSPILQAVSQLISPDGRTVQFYATLSAGPSGSTAAMNATPAVRAAVAHVAAQVGAAQNADFSADSAAYDINHIANSDLKHIIPLVLVIILLLLAILLRSAVAPWYLIATVGLSYLASLGLAMLVFVRLGHQDGLFFILPFLMFIFCMALGEDYNILVMSRIREEAHNAESLPQAVTRAMGVTGTTVTSAGLILAGTFTVFGTVGGDWTSQQIGYGVAFGILLDTFFVRTLLVPSIVALLDHYNWWPSHLYHKSRARG